MSTIVVRYRVKNDRAEENQRLIEHVFRELDESQADGFTYKVFRFEDGVSFMHVLIEHEDVPNPDDLSDVSAFQAFLVDLDDRCAIPPTTMGADIIGGHR